MLCCHGWWSSMQHERDTYGSYQHVWWDGTRIEGSEICTSTEKESYLSWCLKGIGSFGDGVLKMTRGSMVVLKGVWRNNLYYLKSSTVTGQVATSIDSDDDCTRFGKWDSDIQEKSLCKLLQSKVYWKVSEPANKIFMNIASSERKPRWNSVLQLIAPRKFRIMFTLMFEDLSRWHLLEATTTLCLL